MSAQQGRCGPPFLPAIAPTLPIERAGNLIRDASRTGTHAIALRSDLVAVVASLGDALSFLLLSRRRSGRDSGRVTFVNRLRLLLFSAVGWHGRPVHSVPVCVPVGVLSANK
jgi:hypothetical protein